MKDSDRQRIRHIKSYCEKTAKTINRFGCDYNTFINDIDYYQSISMSLMQIGELSAGLSEEFKNATNHQMQWGLMKGMRNLFAHAYHSMDIMVVWEVATRDIPALLHFCDKTLDSELENSSPSTDRQKSSVLKRLEENKKIVAEQSGRKSGSKKRSEPER